MKSRSEIYSSMVLCVKISNSHFEFQRHELSNGRKRPVNNYTAEGFDRHTAGFPGSTGAIADISLAVGQAINWPPGITCTNSDYEGTVNGKWKRGDRTSTTKCSYVWLSVHCSSSHSTKWGEGSHRVQFPAQTIKPQQLQTHGEGCGQKWWLMRTGELSLCRDFHLHSNQPRELWLRGNSTKYRYSKQSGNAPSYRVRTQDRVSKSHFFTFLFLIYSILITENCNRKQKNFNTERSSCSYWWCWCSPTTPNNGNTSSLNVVILVWDNLYTSNISVRINPYIQR